MPRFAHGDRRRKIRDGKPLEEDIECPTANPERPMAARGIERTGSRTETDPIIHLHPEALSLWTQRTEERSRSPIR